MMAQNVPNDGDKGVQICISPKFIEPSVYQRIKTQGMHQSWMHVSDTDGRTDCSAGRARRKENKSMVDSPLI